VLGSVAAALPHPEVRGLDVPVVDPGPVQRDQRFQQVAAPAFQQIQGQSLTAAQYAGQGLVAGALQ
jgi:hypothetical protein